MTVQSAHAERLAGVELNATDRAILTFVAEHYGVTLDQLQHINAVVGTGGVVSKRAVRSRVERWKRRGLVVIVERQGRHWVTPTDAGYAYVDLAYPVWGVSDARVAHVSAVTDFRLWYESDPTRVTANGVWISERRLFRERGRANWHLHDGALATPGAVGRVGLEVELTLKTPTLQRYGSILANLGPGVTGVMYVCRPAIADRVKRTVERCNPAVPVWVRSLPSRTDGQGRELVS